MKPTWNPASGKLGRLDFSIATECESLFSQVGSCAGERPLGADNGGRIALAFAAVSIKKKLRLRVLVFDTRLAE